MQLVPLGAADRAADRVRASGASAGAPSSAQRLLPLAGGDPATSTAVPMPRLGLGAFAPALNQQVATAQQSLGYLGELASQLQGLKSQLSLQIAGGFVPEGRLQSQRQRLERLWQERPAQSGGGLNDQLAFSGDGKALQHFTLPGLDQRSLQSPGSETLAFALPGAARQPPVTVRIEPGLSARAQANRLDHALAPTGIRVRAGEQGDLDFSVDEAQWARLRDGLEIKGGGKRFAAGQFTRVRPEAPPAALAPASWQLEDTAGQRQALPLVMQAATKVEQTREQVRGVLTQADDTLSRQRTVTAGADAASFAEHFSRLGQDTRYSGLSALASSLRGLPRYRIESLLALNADSAAP